MSPRPWCRIDGCARNREGHLGTHARLAPDLEVTADLLGPLTHARQAKVPGSMAIDHLRVDALAVVADTQLKLAVIVPHLHFNPTSAGVQEGIAQGLTGNPIDVVANDRAKSSWRAVDGHIECCRVCARVIRLSKRKFLAKTPERDGEIIGGSRRGSQALDGVPSLPDRLRALLECDIQPLLGVERPIGENVGRGLKAKHDAMKALQKRVVELTGNARPLIETFLESGVKLVRELSHAELIQPPDQCQRCDDYPGAKPRGLVVSGRNREIH